MKKFETLVKVLRKFSIEEVLKFERKFDRQFLALGKLYLSLRDPLVFFNLVLLNSIVSYQLLTRGEEYWEKFSEYFRKKRNIELPADIIKFIEKYNYRFLNTKIKRILKLWNFLRNLSLKDFDIYSKDMIKLNVDLARIMNQRKDAKTIVFSVKMFGYAYRVVYKRKLVFPKEIHIPLDVRLQKISRDKDFWKRLSEETEISMLHLDSLIWVTLGLSYEDIKKINDMQLKEKVIELKQTLDSLMLL